MADLGGGRRQRPRRKNKREWAIAAGGETGRETQVGAREIGKARFAQEGETVTRMCRAVRPGGDRVPGHGCESRARWSIGVT